MQLIKMTKLERTLAKHGLKIGRKMSKSHRKAISRGIKRRNGKEAK